MEPSVIASGGQGLLPSATTWYMNPFFLASFGAFAALGFVMLVTAYFILVRSKKSLPGVDPDARCATCGMTGDMLSKLMPCQAHEGLRVRIETIDKWIFSHEGDYRELRQRIDNIERERANEQRNSRR